MMHVWRSIIIVCVSVVLHIPTVTMGASDFTIQVLVGQDTIPPTVPVIQTVTPIAATQIDITWFTSTDNVGVAGYQVWRDGSIIATTSTNVTFYADTGLVPETLYTYTISAFDAVDNFSASSSPVATTTFALPPPPATTTPEILDDSLSQATYARTVLESLRVEPGLTEATLTAQVHRPVQLIVKWGITAEYEQGVIRTDRFATAHEVSLPNLQPKTKYFYSITGVSARGVETLLYEHSFFTLPELVSPIVPNVSQLVGTVEGNAVVQLRWQNPFLPNGAFIRVVRSPYSWPISVEAGEFVYQGRGQLAADTIDFSAQTRWYYSVFVIWPSGETSSGAVVAISSSYAEEMTDAYDDDPLINDEVTPRTYQAPGIKLPAPEEIEIIQGERVYTFQDQAPVLQAPEIFIIRIPAQSVATHLKSIIVTLQDVSDQRQVYSYLLRLSEDADFYEGAIPAVEVAGQSRLTVVIYDFEAAMVGRYQNLLTFELTQNPQNSSLLSAAWLWQIGKFGWLLIMVPLLWWAALRYQRSDDVRINTPQKSLQTATIEKVI